MSVVQGWEMRFEQVPVGYTYGWPDRPASSGVSFTADADGNPFQSGVVYTLLEYQPIDGAPSGTPPTVKPFFFSFRADGSLYNPNPDSDTDTVETDPNGQIRPDPDRPGHYIDDSIGKAGYYTRAQLRAQTWTPDSAPYRLDLREQGWSGPFQVNLTDADSPDDNGMRFRTKSGILYERLKYGQPINPLTDYGALGDGVARELDPDFHIETDWFVDLVRGVNFNPLNDWCDTYALQAAAYAVSRANDAGAYVSNSPAVLFPNTLKITHGNYFITEEIPCRGSLVVEMDASGSYGGTRIVQLGEAQHHFHIYADTDGHSSAVAFFYGILRGAVATTNANTGAVYVGDYVPTQVDIDKANSPTATKFDIWKSWGDGNGNSTRIYKTWFSTNNHHAVHIKRGNDVVLQHITIDVQAFRGIRLGSETGKVTDFHIDGATVYDCRTGIIDLYNVDGGIINNIRPYSDNQLQVTPYFLNAAGKSVRNVEVYSCMPNGVKKLAIIGPNTYGVHIHHCHHWKGVGRSAEFVGGAGATVDNVRITDCDFEGDYSGVTTEEGYTVPEAPIFANATRVVNSEVTRNRYRHTGTGTAPTPMLFNHGGTLNNDFSNNRSLFFSDEGRIANGLRNEFIEYRQVHTQNWDATAIFHQVLEPDVLEHPWGYDVVMEFHHPGFALINQVFSVNGIPSAPGAPESTYLIPITYGNYNNNGGYFKFRYLRSTTGGTYGLEAAPSYVTTEGSAAALKGTLSIAIRRKLPTMRMPPLLTAPPTQPSGNVPPSQTTTPWVGDTDDGPDLIDVQPAGTENCQNYHKLTQAEFDALPTPHPFLYEYNDGTPRQFASAAEARTVVSTYGNQGSVCGGDFCGATHKTCEIGDTVYNDNRPDHIQEESNGYWPQEEGWRALNLVKPTATVDGSVVLIAINACGVIVARQTVILNKTGGTN